MLSYLVISSSGEAMPGSRLAEIGADVRAVLQFEPRFEMSWIAAGGRVAMLAWDLHPDGYPPGPRWYVDGDGLTAFSGLPQPSAGSWPTDSWARQLHQMSRRDGPGVGAGCWGVFTIVHLDAAGSGFVASDPLAVGAVFRSRAGPLELVANRPEIVAAAAGSQHQRDVSGVGWLVANDYILDDSTTFATVRSLRAGRALRIDGNHGTVADVADSHRVWSSPPPPHDDALELAASELTSHIDVITKIDRPVRLMLTGGFDSRLVLALALAVGAERRFRYATVESFPDEVDPDVIVASALADRYDLDHDLVRAGRTEWSSFDFEQRVREHAAITSGMLGAKNLRSQLVLARHTQIGGAFGELLTGQRSGHRPPASVGDVDEYTLGRLYGGAAATGLMTPDAKQHYRDELRRLVEQIADDGTPPDEIPYRFYVDQLTANWLPHELHIRDITPNMQPLYSTHVVAVARAAGWHGRRSFRLHFALMMRLAPDLATTPFAMHGWPDLLLDTLADGERFRVAPVVRDAAPRGLRGLAWSDHVDVFAKYLLDEPSNPIHEIIDRSVVEAVLSGRQPMPAGGVAQLHNALGAAVWLGCHELPPPPIDGHAVERAG